MHIDKYLCEAKKPSFPPGPFSLRLKYELKQAYFERRMGYSTHLLYATAIVCLFILCTFMVIKPQTAQRLNTFVMGEKTNETLETLLVAGNDIDLSRYPTGIRTVSAEVNSTFPFIEEDKSYLVHKFTNHENQTLIYISEVKRPYRSY